MSLKAFNCGANALCYIKDNKQYGMTCAWATMIAYDKVGMLVGEQSATGNNLFIGDIVGISALAKEQEKIALTLGNYDVSSKDHDKVNDIKENIYYKDNAILIKDAKVNMIAKVEKILLLDKECNDHFIIFSILESNEDDTKEFLSGYFMEEN